METESVNETTADLAERIVSLAAAKPTDKVTILGNREIELLLTLARQGFIEVTCRETAGGPHAESDDADLVLVPMVKSETEFALAAAEACRHLKQGGVFLARLADLSAAALVAIGDIMGRYGFAAIPEPGNLLCCRRLAAPLS